MITHCPSCHTHFRVRAEQLAARAGQVRCGKCGRVFDALEHLVEEVAAASTSRSSAEFESLRAAVARAKSTPESPAAEAAYLGVEAQARVTARTPNIQAHESDAKFGMPKAATQERAPMPSAITGDQVTAGTNKFDFGPVAATDSGRRARSWPWMLGAVLSLLILLAQAAYYYRSTMIVLFPAIKPYAAALCARLGCELPLPRRIELQSIEASDLQADTTNPNIMVLSATLRNRAVFNQPYPMLELTLTDSQDQPLVRRVLAPQDYLGKAVNIAAGFAANAEISIKVYIEASQVKATGYRLYLFFP